MVDEVPKGQDITMWFETKARGGHRGMQSWGRENHAGRET